MPNRLVEVNSWNRSACYPQGSFYPLSDGRSASYRRVTNSCFRTCSRCTSRSQASFCVCAYTSVSNRCKDTFERLRYSLGGDRPSQTARRALFQKPSKGLRLGRTHSEGGIQTAAPHKPKSVIHSLPPILCTAHGRPMPNYSEAPWGLSV